MIGQMSTRLSQIMGQMSINQQQPAFGQKNLYEVATTLGKLTFQVTKFPQYVIIIITYSGALKLDGYLQLAYPTPYSNQPSVINLEKDQGQMDNESFSQRLSKQINCPIFLSFNLEELKKGQQEELYIILKNILLPKKKSPQHNV